MKKSFLMLAIASIAIAGCNIKSNEERIKETDEIIKKAEQNIDELFYSGGQPGQITVKGVIVKKDGDKMLLDDRIRIEQVGGKGKRGDAPTLVSEKNKAVLSEEIDVQVLSSAIESVKYINLGCNDLTAQDTEGLTEELEETKIISAVAHPVKKIFICGTHQIPQAFLSLSADQLILKNTSLKLKDLTGNLNVSASKIELIGSNTIETIGVDSTLSIMVGPSLNLLVAHEISGEGTLKLSSIGGNYIREGEKK